MYSCIGYVEIEWMRILEWIENSIVGMGLWYGVKHCTNTPTLFRPGLTYVDDRARKFYPSMTIFLIERLAHFVREQDEVNPLRTRRVHFAVESSFQRRIVHRTRRHLWVGEIWIFGWFWFWVCRCKTIATHRGLFGIIKAYIVLPILYPWDRYRLPHSVLDQRTA